MLLVMSTKKIQYNPNILSSIKMKTKTQRLNRPLMINQNSLKTQLISRIKNHKQTELKNEKLMTVTVNPNKKTPVNFADEFNDSINYLSTLSKKHKLVEQNLNKTIRQKHDDSSQIHVDLELPNELKEIIPSINSSLPISTYKLDNQVPWGCLKNGIKPTYKQFTRRNLPTPIVEQKTEKTEKTERERKLDLFKQQYKTLVTKEPTYEKPIDMIEPTYEKSIDMIEPTYEKSIDMIEPIYEKSIDMIESINNLNINELHLSNLDSPSLNPIIEPIPRPKLIKKTIRRKFTLGKSNIYKKVAVLIKNNETRKKIIIAQKELKKKSIHEIKKYLKEHFLLKSGSSAPNEVLRKMYESAMLTGHIMNNNKDTILHNFMNDTKE